MFKHTMTGYGLRRSSAIVILLVIIAMAAVLLLVANIGYVTDQQGEGILGPGETS